MDREEKIKLIESYHKSLGYQSWLPFYLDNCNTGISLDTISDDELQKILLFKTIRLTEREFIKSISWYVLQISYDKGTDGMFIKNLIIHPMLNGFSMSNEFAYYYFRSNDKEPQIKIIEKNIVPLIPYTGKIEKTLTLNSIVYEDEIATLKNMIEERKQEIYRYMIGNIILSNCDIDKYEVII